MLHLILDIVKNSILVTGLVVIMMMMIESINIESKGKIFNRLKKNRFGQIVIASLLGSVPGCMGGFATVSLYTHGMFSFGALVAMMIASSGDEAFVMLAMFPEKAAILFAILFVLAIIVGVGVDLVGKRFGKEKTAHADHLKEMKCGEEYEIHAEEKHEGRHFGWKRAVILIGTLIFALALGLGYLEHDHEGHNHESHGQEQCTEACQHDHSHCTAEHDHAIENHSHDHATENHSHAKKGSGMQINLLSEGWMHIFFACLCLIMIAVIAFASDHFIEEHLWHHVICKHLPSIFLWTFGVLAAIALLSHFVNIEAWISDNTALMILLAVAIGIIPESGPHLVFVTLFASGIIPFPVLLASSISQDGHAALPLLAESKKAFLKAKAINCLVALVCGFLAMLFL